MALKPEQRDGISLAKMGIIAKMGVRHKGT